MNSIVYIRSKCGQEREGVKKIPKFCGHHIWKLPKTKAHSQLAMLSN